MGNRKDTVYVMMSTYNGEQFLRTQIDSLLKQEGVDVEVVIRDDGSTDGTRDILDDYQQESVYWYQGKNIGAIESFYELLYESPDRPYYAFCDQDDYWYPEKLRIAVSKIGKTDNPVMYFSKKRIVDENLNPIGREDEPVNSLTVGGVLLRGVAYGCTMVLNKAAVDLIKKHYPSVVQMHDVYAQRVVGICGKLIYDKEAHIDYRQHQSNVVGAQKTMLNRVKKGVSTILERSRDHYRSDVAKDLYEGYKDLMLVENQQFIYDFSCVKSSLTSRIRLICDRRLKAQTKMESIVIRMLILLGWV